MPWLTVHHKTMLQAASLLQLEKENQDAAEKLRIYVRNGEQQLARVQQALVEIAEAQLAARKLEVNVMDITLIIYALIQ